MGQCSLVVEHLLRKQKVAGSIPVVGYYFFLHPIPGKRALLFPDSQKQITQSAVWSSGMILRLGRRGPGFESLNGPFYIACGFPFG